MPYKDEQERRAYQRDWARKNGTAQRNTERRRRLCKQVQAYKVERGCERCGYCRSPYALELHHPHGKGGQKTGIAQLVRRGFAWSKIEAELSRCTLLCANCHREEHE